jgi:hypothetical protein
MAAATQDRDTPRHGGVEFGIGAKAGVKLFAGTIACVDASGFGVKGSTSTTLKALGITQSQIDNTTGQNGDATITYRRGCFRLANSASTDQITNADIGASAYIVDDQTVAKTSGSNTRSVAGVIRGVDGAGVWVDF